MIMETLLATSKEKILQIIGCQIIGVADFFSPNNPF